MTNIGSGVPQQQNYGCGVLCYKLIKRLIQISDGECQQMLCPVKLEFDQLSAGVKIRINCIFSHVFFVVFFKIQIEKAVGPRILQINSSECWTISIHTIAFPHYLQRKRVI